MKYSMGVVAACAVLAAGAVLVHRGTAEPPVQIQRVEKVEVQVPAPPDSGGALQGIIIENERPQPYLGVVLLAPNGAEMASTRTDERGVFLFQAVAPGSYVVSARKTESSGPAVGTVRVTVQPGRVQDVTLRLVKTIIPLP